MPCAEYETASGHSVSAQLRPQAGGVPKEASCVAIERVDACRQKLESLGLGEERIPLERDVLCGEEAIRKVRRHADEYVLYDNFKIPLHPDSADRRLPNGLFIRAEDVGCRAVRGAGSVFAVRLYSLTVKECIVRACQEMGCTIGDMQIGLLCPDSWDEETKMAVENSILCLRIPTPEDNVERIEHVHRCQLVWIRESQASFLSAVVDAEVPPGRSTTIVADVGGHTTDLMAMTINNVPHQETRLQDVLAQRGRRLGGNEVDDTLKEFLFLHFFEPLGVTRARMLNNPNAVYELRSQLEELKTTHDPSRIATTDEEKLARPRQKTHHELDLRNIEDLFPDKNWMAAFAERVGVLNQRPDNPLPFFEAEGPQRIQGVRNFRDRLANAPYVPGDKTGSFNMKGGILSLPTKLFKHVLDKHAEALVEIVLEFITAINNTPAETVSPGGTLEGDGDHERRSIKTILFTGEGATGAAHRQILRNLSAMQLLPGQPERTVYFPEGTSTHCLRGGHLILMHYRNIHRVLRATRSLGARLGVFLRDHPSDDGKPTILRSTVRNAGITERDNSDWQLWRRDRRRNNEWTMDIVVPAVQMDDLVTTADRYSFGEVDQLYDLDAGDTLCLDIYHVDRHMPRLGSGQLPFIVSHRKPRASRSGAPEVAPPNKPLLSQYAHRLQRYTYANRGPARKCRTFIRFSDENKIVVECQFVDVAADGTRTVSDHHVMVADLVSPQANLGLVPIPGSPVPHDIANAQLQAQAALQAGVPFDGLNVLAEVAEDLMDLS